MIQDEFNKVEITNDKQLLKVEFGKTQKVEFTSKKENEIPEGDLNEKYVGKTIKKVTEVNVDYVNKVPTHATQTVVTTATTATSAGAAAAATAVTASTVAVVAIATATGISVALHDYHYEFQTFLISSNELKYGLTVFDNNDKTTYLSYEESDEPSSSDLEEDPFDTAPFVLRVFNSEYSDSKPIFYHEENYGVFEGLELNETYSITLTENRYGGETIYKDAFKTYTNTEFKSFNITGDCDMEDNFFEVNMEFVDESDLFSNFSITLFDPELPEEINYTFAIKKQTGNQYITTLDENENPIIDYTRPWNYKFSYISDGKTIEFDSGTVTFRDWLDRISTFNKLVFDKTADFVENTIKVKLDYRDDFGWYKNFKLVFSMTPTESVVPGDGTGIEEEPYTFEIPLSADSDQEQTISLNEYQVFAYDSNFKYTYRLICDYRDVETVVAEETTPFVFTDSLNRVSRFNQFVFDKTANFIDNSFQVRLDYQDDFNWFEDFVLKVTMIPSENGDEDGSDQPEEEYYSFEVPLDSKTTVQEIVGNEYEMYVRDTYFEYTYSLSCMFHGVETILEEETTPFGFTDNSGGVSKFNGFEFSKEANFITKSFKVTLDYQDDFGDFEDFKLTLYPNGVNAQYDFALQKTTEEQTLTFDSEEHYLFSMDYEYSYVLTCFDYFKYEEVELDRSENEFTFTDISNGRAEFNGVTFTGQYQISSGKAPVQLDFVDDYGDYLSDFVLHLSAPIINQPGGEEPNPIKPLYANTGDAISVDDYPFTFNLDATTEVQYINLYSSEIPTSLDAKYTFAITYKRHGVDQEPYIGEQQIEFNDPDAASEVTGITFVNGEANFNDRSFMVELNYQDDFGYFDRFTLQIWDDTNGGWVERELDKTTEPQRVVIDDFDYEEYIYPVDIVEGSLTYNLTYTSSETGDPATQYLFESPQPLSFTNSLKSEFYGLDTTFDITEVSSDFYTEYRLPFRFDMINDAEYFSAPELYVTSVDDEDEILATFAFQNETMDSGWQYGSFTPDSNSGFTLEQLTNGDEYNLVVACYEKDGYNGSDSRVIKYSEPHSFTLNQNQEVCGIEMSNYIVYGDWKCNFSPVGNGDFTTFENCQIIFESTEDGTVLTYDLTLAESVEIDLLSPKDRTTTEQFIDDFFSHSVNVTFKYSKPGSEEIITLDCFSNFSFWISN